MSDFSKGKGIHTYTVQEAVNQHLGKVIHVTPGVLAGTTHAGDVMFDGVAEIENAVSQKGGTSRLVAISITDFDVENHDFDIVFHSVGGYVLGSQGAAVTISDANLKKLHVLGTVRIDWSDYTIPMATNAGIITLGQGSTSTEVPLPILLQANSDSTSVYFQCVAREEAAWAATSNLKFTFHIEYK